MNWGSGGEDDNGQGGKERGQGVMGRSGYARGCLTVPSLSRTQEKKIVQKNLEIEALPPSPHTVIQLSWSNIKLLRIDGNSLRGWFVRTPPLNASTIQA